MKIALQQRKIELAKAILRKEIKLRGEDFTHFSPKEINFLAKVMAKHSTLANLMAQLRR